MLEVIFFFKKNLVIFNHLDEHFWYKKLGISAIKKIAKYGLDPLIQTSLHVQEYVFTLYVLYIFRCGVCFFLQPACIIDTYIKSSRGPRRRLQTGQRACPLHHWHIPQDGWIHRNHCSPSFIIVHHLLALGKCNHPRIIMRNPNYCLLSLVKLIYQYSPFSPFPLNPFLCGLTDSYINAWITINGVF